MKDKRIIKVLIVDDSVTMRETLAMMIEKNKDMKVIGKAANPYEAVSIMRKIKPDVITLDIEMPKMDGLTFTKKIMSQHPIPIIIISSLTLNSIDISLRALEAGAVEIISKPFSKSIGDISPDKYIARQIRRAALAKVRYIAKKKGVTSSNSSIKPASKDTKAAKAIFIGASTGGTEAISRIVENLSPPLPPIVIVQHMPPVFTKAFADRLNGITSLSVKEAAEGDMLYNNNIYIAPGGIHLLIKAHAAGYKLTLHDSAPVNHVKPSIDITFQSAAQVMKTKATGILLTGMGADGAKGLKLIRDAGGKTIAQDEYSCVVYGMPKAAMELGAAQYSMNIKSITDYINNMRI